MGKSFNIHTALPSWIRFHFPGDIAICNYFMGCYECDVLRVTNDDKLFEYEIKISRSDFKADFKKGKKHGELAQGKRVNRFYFVVPENLITKEECPEHAGLIYFIPSDYGYKSLFCLVKTAPILQKNKIKIDHFHIARMLSLRNDNVNRILHSRTK